MWNYRNGAIAGIFHDSAEYENVPSYELVHDTFRFQMYWRYYFYHGVLCYNLFL